MSFEPAGFAREINRAPRQGKQPELRVYSRLLPESWLLLGDIEREGEREREERESTTMVVLQQCGSATRCTEIPIGCQITIRLVGHCTTTDYHALSRIEQKVLALFKYFNFCVARSKPENFVVCLLIKRDETFCCRKFFRR